MKFIEQLNDKRRIVKAQKKADAAYEDLKKAVYDYAYYVESDLEHEADYREYVAQCLEYYKVAKEDLDKILEHRRERNTEILKASLKLGVNAALIILAGNLEFEQGKLLPKFAALTVPLKGIE